MPESLINLPGRDDVLSINETEVGEEWRSPNGHVRLTMSKQLWVPIRALMFADRNYRELSAYNLTYSARNIFNSATLDIRTSEGLRTAPVIQRGISSLFAAISEQRKLSFDEIKATEEEILELFEDAAVRDMKAEQSQMEEQRDDIKGATAYFALKGLLTHSDLWDDRNTQRAKLPSPRAPLPSSPDSKDGLWLPSQHALIISQGAKELRNRLLEHKKTHTNKPFDLSAAETWRLLHRHVLFALEHLDLRELPSEAVVKNYFAPNSETYVRYFTMTLFIADNYHKITDT